MGFGGVDLDCNETRDCYDRHMKLARILAVSAALFCFAGAGAVQADAHKTNAPKSAKKVKVYDFSGDSIEGKLIQPDGIICNIFVTVRESILIRLRRNFDGKIVRSALDL